MDVITCMHLRRGNEGRDVEGKDEKSPHLCAQHSVAYARDHLLGKHTCLWAVSAQRLANTMSTPACPLHPDAEIGRGAVQIGPPSHSPTGTQTPGACAWAVNLSKYQTCDTCAHIGWSYPMCICKWWCSIPQRRARPLTLFRMQSVNQTRKQVQGTYKVLCAQSIGESARDIRDQAATRCTPNRERRDHTRFRPSLTRQ
jgi:hypothetical protein